MSDRDETIFSNGPYRMKKTRYGVMLYNRNDIYIGRSLDTYGEYSQGEGEVFRQLVRDGNVIADVGANVGAHTLLFSRLVGQTGCVLAFEPQRLVFQMLCANMALNGVTNTRCFHRAIGDEIGSMVVPVLDQRREGNFGGLGLGSHENGENVPIVTLDSYNLWQCDFLKVDVEGMEMRVLRGAADTIRKHKPILYVENDRKENSPALIEQIASLGYRMYWHLAPLFTRNNYFGADTNLFGEIASINMLCYHESVKAKVQGLDPVAGPQDWRVRA